MNEFQKVIRELIELFGQLTALEQIKLDAAAGKHPAAVEECMTKEQALTLKLRGLEQERERRQEQAGLKGLKFREILERAEEKDREQLLPLFEELSRQIQMFQETNEAAIKVLHANLYMMDQALRIKTGDVYKQDGKTEKEPTHFTNSRV